MFGTGRFPYENERENMNETAYVYKPVATVVGMIADGMSVEGILKSFPDLEIGDITEALRLRKSVSAETSILKYLMKKEVYFIR